MCVCATQPGVCCGVCVCSSWGPGKGRARRAALHRQVADHPVRSAAPVCVCVGVRWMRLVVVVHAPLEMRVAAQVLYGGGVYNPEVNPEAAFR